jgi:hypothetical protein
MGQLPGNPSAFQIYFSGFRTSLDLTLRRLLDQAKNKEKEAGGPSASAPKERHLDMLFKMSHLQRSILFVYGFYKDVAAMRLMLTLRN